MGGGSGAREPTPSPSRARLRDEFRERRYPGLDPDEFNWGGPRSSPTLELDAHLPAACAAVPALSVDRSARRAA